MLTNEQVAGLITLTIAQTKDIVMLKKFIFGLAKVQRHYHGPEASDLLQQFQVEPSTAEIDKNSLELIQKLEKALLLLRHGTDPVN